MYHCIKPMSCYFWRVGGVGIVLGSLPSENRYFLNLPEAILTLLSGDCYSRGGGGGGSLYYRKFMVFSLDYFLSAILFITLGWLTRWTFTFTWCTSCPIPYYSSGDRHWSYWGSLITTLCCSDHIKMYMYDHCCNIQEHVFCIITNY